jgi:hypothetical protein
MTIRIDLNNTEILKVKNSIYSTLNETICNLIQEKNIKVPDNIKILLQDTDQEVYGVGAVTADISDYLKDKKSVLIFADLVKQTIESEYADFNRFIGCIDHLWNFYDALIKYAQTLPN